MEVRECLLCGLEIPEGRFISHLFQSHTSHAQGSKEHRVIIGLIVEAFRRMGFVVSTEVRLPERNRKCIKWFKHCKKKQFDILVRDSYLSKEKLGEFIIEVYKLK